MPGNSARTPFSWFGSLVKNKLLAREGENPLADHLSTHGNRNRVCVCVASRSRQTLLVTFWDGYVATFYDYFHICVGWNRSIYPRKPGILVTILFNISSSSDSSLIVAPIVPDGPLLTLPLLLSPSIYIHPHPFIFPATIYI